MGSSLHSVSGPEHNKNTQPSSTTDCKITAAWGRSADTLKVSCETSYPQFPWMNRWTAAGAPRPAWGGAIAVVPDARGSDSATSMWGWFPRGNSGLGTPAGPCPIRSGQGSDRLHRPLDSLHRDGYNRKIPFHSIDRTSSRRRQAYPAGISPSTIWQCFMLMKCNRCPSVEGV
jgi:hypothetical protein